MKIREVELSLANGAPVGLSAQELVYIRRAWHLARMSTERQKHGAILISGRKTIAVACNTFRNDPKNVTNPDMECSYHAEQNLLKQIASSSTATYQSLAKSARIYVVRINNREQLMPSKPCSKCEALMIAAGIKEVVHS